MPDGTNRSFVFTRCSSIVSLTLTPWARKIHSRDGTALSEDVDPSFPESYRTKRISLSEAEPYAS